MSGPVHVDDARPRGWFYIDNSVLDDHGRALGAPGLAVYAALARRADRSTSECWPSIRHLAQQVGLSRNTVRRALATLEGLGLVSVVARTSTQHDRESNLYRLERVGVGQSVTHVGQSVTHGGSNGAPRVGQNVPTNKTHPEQDSEKHMVGSPKATPTGGGASSRKRERRPHTAEERTVASDIITHLNKLAGSRYRAEGRGAELIVDRLREGYTRLELGRMATFVWRELWRDRPEMRRGYFRPATLYNREKCETYCGQMPPKYVSDLQEATA